MDDCTQIRRMRYQEGLTLRAIAKKTGLSRVTIARLLENGPARYHRQVEPRKPKLGPFTGVIEQILAADRKEKKKERHTAKRIFERLRDEHGYPGGYTQVKDYVREARTHRKEAYVPLDFAPGTGQVDWGEASMNENGVVKKGWMFVMTLPFSNARFSAFFPRGTAEFFYEGHLRAFEHFGGVPTVLIYDNLSTAVKKICKNKQRKLTPRFERFAAHYLFTPRFCSPGKGNEKGHVENGVRWTRQNFFVPRPELNHGWEVFNASLVEKVKGTYTQRCRGHREIIAKRLAEEQTALMPLPPEPPLLLQPTSAQVNSLCLVRFETNDYSVPCRYAHHKPVLVQATLDTVRISYQGERIATHRRCYDREQSIYEPWHYLPLLERKPGALDDAAPLKQLQLDPCFDGLRAQLEALHEGSEGTRAFIQVLRLLEHHSQGALTRAVQRALALGVHDAEAVKNLLLCPPEHPPSQLDLAGRMHLAAYRIAPVDLSAYTSLTGGREAV